VGSRVEEKDLTSNEGENTQVDRRKYIGPMILPTSGLKRPLRNQDFTRKIKWKITCMTRSVQEPYLYTMLKARSPQIGYPSIIACLHNTSELREGSFK
jgi:hypothetical protein